MLIERVYIPEELGSNPDAAETVYDNEVHLETFKEYHSGDNWVINAVTQCNFVEFLILPLSVLHFGIYAGSQVFR